MMRAAKASDDASTARLIPGEASASVPASRKPNAKPLLRGVSHAVASLAAVVSGLGLVLVAPSEKAKVATAVYSLSLFTLFAVSALYHIPHWEPKRRLKMRRLDHSAIFVLIAGTYTAIVLLTFQEACASFLSLIWCAAGIGVLQSVFWPQAPKTLVALLCLLMGYAGIIKWKTFKAGLSTEQVALVALGGLFYSVGAVGYATRWPLRHNKIFGYHEVFHVNTILATVCHWLAIYQLSMQDNRNS
mmetsp:Transcript_1029/g.2336  ORF Transcript_1029/g.2336 Transcript_1029/m.2336 type:complete len:245 (+) Transcript_1029:85-819(+)